MTDERKRHMACKCSAVLLTCAALQGCLLNSVQRLNAAPETKPDAAHAIVVVGIGLEVPYSYAAFQGTLVEYSMRNAAITGNCFHYNRIELTAPSRPAKVRYFAFEVPANAYAYLDNANAPLLPSPAGRAFIAPPGGTVYFGDYVLVGEKSIEYRSDLNAARRGAQSLLPKGAVLQSAEPTAATHVHIPICTP